MMDLVMFGWMVMATILFIQQVLFQSFALKWQGSSLLINFGMDLGIWLR